MLALYRYLSAQASCASTPPAAAPYETCRAIRLQGINTTPLMLIAFARGRPRGAHPDAPRHGREEGTAVSEPRRAVHSIEAPHSRCFIARCRQTAQPFPIRPPMTRRGRAWDGGENQRHPEEASA